MQRAGPLVLTPELLPRALGFPGKEIEPTPWESGRQGSGLLCVGLHGNAQRTHSIASGLFLKEDFPPNLGL